MRFASKAMLLVVGLGDRLVPKRNDIVLRTGPDFDDQGREILKALARLGHTRVTWLVSGSTDPGPAGPVECVVLPVRSAAGVLAYWRSLVVVHTHGVFGSRRGSRRKSFVNVWHGMPIKRLEQATDVGRHQTDWTIATSPIHARNLATTWRLGADRVPITGLPRNDVLVRGARTSRPKVLAELARGRPLVVWLPTFRRMAGEDGPVDGVDSGNVSQLFGGTDEALNGVLSRLGVQAILKAHPLAPRPETASLSNLEVWSEEDLGRAGMTLYELLSHADYLITDQSSVWVDFLLTQRPMIFTLSDLEEYAESRGFYFWPLESFLPGPVVTDLAGLERELGALVDGRDDNVARRREALDLHHTHQDSGSADRVAARVLDLLHGVASGADSPNVDGRRAHAASSYWKGPGEWSSCYAAWGWLICLVVQAWANSLGVRSPWAEWGRFWL